MQLLFPLILLLSLLGATWMAVQRPEVVRTHPYQGGNSLKLLQFNPDNIRNLRLERGAQVCILRHQEGYWQITSPLRERVHQALPAILIQLANQAQSLDSFTLEEMRERGQKLEDYGLGKKAIRIRYANEQDEALFHLEIGELCPWHVPAQPDPNKQPRLEPTLYLRLPNSPASERIFLIPSVVRGELKVAGISQKLEEANLPQLLSRPFEQFRSAQLLPLSALNASQLRWQTDNFTTEVQRQQRGWEITSPIATPARQSSIEALLSQFCSQPAYQLIEQEALPFPAEFTTLNLIAPDLNGKERNFELQIALPTSADIPSTSKNEPNQASPESLILVRPSHRKLLFAFEAKDQAWLVPKLKNLRSRQLLDLQGWAIEEILLHSPRDLQKQALILAIDQGQPSVSWLSSPSSNFARTRPADVDNLDALVRLLLQSEVTDFISDAPADSSRYGFDKPLLVIELKLQKANLPNTPVSQQEADKGLAPQQRRLEVLISQGEDARYYAQRSDGISVFEVNPDLINQIPLDPGFWRSKQITDYASSEILEIRRKRQGLEDELISFNPLLDKQQLMIGNREASELLLPQQVRKLIQTLSQLRASAWISKPTRLQQQALNQAMLQLEITTGRIDMSQNQGNLNQSLQNLDEIPNLRTESLLFSVVNSSNQDKQPLWLGQFEGEESAFIVPASLIDLLSSDLTSLLDFEPSEIAPPPPAPQ